MAILDCTRFDGQMRRLWRSGLYTTGQETLWHCLGARETTARSQRRGGRGCWLERDGEVNVSDGGLKYLLLATLALGTGRPVVRGVLGALRLPHGGQRVAMARGR